MNIAANKQVVPEPGKTLAALNAEIDGLIEEQKREIMETIYLDIIYDFHSREKYTLTHNFDPPYDCSGAVAVFQDNQTFIVSDYKTIGDFLDEYTGSSEATYTSGCGLYHRTFYDDYRDELIRDINDKIIDYIAGIGLDCLEAMEDGYDCSDEYKEAKNGSPDDIRWAAAGFADRNDIYYKTSDEIESLLDTVKESSFKEWYDKLSDATQKKLFRERMVAKRELEEHRRKISSDKRNLNAIWKELSIIYTSIYGVEIPKRIEAPQYPGFLEFLKKNGVTGHTFKLIADYAPTRFSNSVSQKLRDEAAKQEKVDIIQISDYK